MSLSSNITIFWDALDTYIATESNATVDNPSGLVTPHRTDVCTITDTETTCPAIEVYGCSTTTTYDAVALVDVGMPWSSAYSSADILFNSTSYDLDDYLGKYRSLGSGLWRDVGWNRDPTIIIDHSDSMSPTLAFADTIWFCPGFSTPYSMTVGRMMFCDKWSPTDNFNFNWQASIIDNSQTVKSIGGQSWTAQKSKQWQVTFDLSAMATEEAVGELAAIAWKLGTHTDFVLALTPNADEADIFTLYGRFTKLPTFTNSKYGLYDTQLVFTESL